MTNTTIPTCPSCGEALLQIKHPHLVILYCGHGRCECSEMNDGAEGTTEAEVVQQLEDAFDFWLAQQEQAEQEQAEQEQAA